MVSGISRVILNQTAKNQSTYVHSYLSDIQKTATIMPVILPCSNISTNNKSMVPSHHSNFFTTWPGLKAKYIMFHPLKSAANVK